MKKNLKLKNILVLFLCIVSIILISSKVLATEPIITPITGDDYNNAQTITDYGNDSNNSNSNSNSNSSDNNLSNNTSNNTNSAKRYNNTNKTVPQTGVQDYNIGILLIIAVAAAIYAYKKVKDYNNI